MTKLTREEFISQYKNIFRSLDQFKEEWQGRCARDIVHEFDSLEHKIEEEYRLIEYMLDHPLTDLHEFDWMLFEHFDNLIQKDLESIRPRIEHVAKLYYGNQGDPDELFYFTSL